MKVSRITRPAIVLAAMSVLWLGLAPAIASAAVPGTAVSAGTGWIRLAHLSPNAPAVDVYLYSFGNPDAKLVLRHVGYGIVSPYEPVAAGDYSVAMRPADAPATTKPMLSAGVMVPGGDAYTVAGVGPYPGLRLQVIEDKLTTPPGRALVRVIQASLRQHQVTVSYAGQLLAARLPFASVSSYRALSPGTATVRVLGAGSRASTDVTLASGTVHTLVVLDGTGGLMIDPL
ncbi:MAG: DUF4397 domain-containing protein, partial [Streptosporangiaceae bacterium]|nr:DUF4397 domain-containing protein [Streptosporangiaceae bacterium]